MSKYDKRLDRLERIYGPAGCTCPGGPGLLIVATGQAVPPPTVCPHHGPIDRTVVKVQARQSAPEPAVQTSARQSAGAVMSDGRVAVTLPSPSRSTHQCTEETDHGPMG